MTDHQSGDGAGLSRRGLLAGAAVGAGIAAGVVAGRGPAAAGAPPGAGAAPWRSSLYPVDWEPGYTDAAGRFLHDFSYAGYRRGERDVPATPPGAVYDVVSYGADPSGRADSTAAIQRAIDAAGAAGGGIVALPAGRYLVAPPSGSNHALWVRHDRVVLRGAGSNATFIENTTPQMRSKDVIRVAPAGGGDWHTPVGAATPLRADLAAPTRVIPLTSAAGYAVGDWVVVRADATDAFIADHGMTGDWNATLQGPTFHRQITAVDTANRTITVDIPTRYWLKTRDNARVYRVARHLAEVGLVGFAIGMRRHPGTGWGENDYTVPGTGAYEVHASNAIQIRHTANAWVDGVATFAPANNGGLHLLSDGLEINKSRSVTVRGCHFARPQYRGGGGNGYGYVIAGSDLLIRDCAATNGRHNFDFKSMWTSGNVLYRNTSHTPSLRSDFHMHLSMANLVDTMTLDKDIFEAKYRPYGTVLHGEVTTQSVFWNTTGAAPMGSATICVESRQFGRGYVIGTRGAVTGVAVGDDFVEGAGRGAELQPQSLYADQLSRRLNRAT